MAGTKKFSWEAPTLNTDGTPIDYDLDYELGISDGAGFQSFAVFPGTLNPEGRYESEFEFESGQYEAAVRAINRTNPAAISDWSNSVIFTISNGIPSAPLDLRAE